MLMITDTISEFASGVNAVQETTALHIFDGWIYVGYTNDLQDAVVVRRPMAGGCWQSVVIGSVLKDSHNGVSVGVDPLGYIHVCWDIHGAEVLNYKVSTAPHVLDFEGAVMGGTPTSTVSYARFYRAGNAFYFLCREGSSGNGDEWIKVWTPAGFVDLAIPLIVGSALAPPDNPYLGQVAPQSNGDLVIVGTSRIGLQNFGVWYVRYLAATGEWVKVDGQPYALPLDRNNLHTIPDTVDGTVANNSLSVVLDGSGLPHVVYQKESGGFQEAFHSVWTGDRWITTQVSNQRSVRLRACPSGPQDGLYRPCDYQMQGPCIVKVGEGFRMFWVRSVAPSPGAWVRPPGILYQADSMTGEMWTVSEVRRDVRQYSGEMPRETAGEPYVLLQELGESTRLLLWDLSAQPALPSPQARLSASLPAGGSRYLDLGNGLGWSATAITISAWIRPNDTGREMTIVDRGGFLADRQFRLLLWGNTVPAPLHYDPARVEVLLNHHSTGWGLVWHPEVAVVPGVMLHLVLTWDGVVVNLYLNGVLAASREYEATMQSSTGSVLLGANKSGVGFPERFWDGWIGLEFYSAALSESEVSALWEAGPQM